MKAFIAGPWIPLFCLGLIGQPEGFCELLVKVC